MSLCAYLLLTDNWSLILSLDGIAHTIINDIGYLSSDQAKTVWRSFCLPLWLYRCHATRIVYGVDVPVKPVEGTMSHGGRGHTTLGSLIRDTPMTGHDLTWILQKEEEAVAATMSHSDEHTLCKIRVQTHAFWRGVRHLQSMHPDLHKLITIDTVRKTILFVDTGSGSLVYLAEQSVVSSTRMVFQYNGPANTMSRRRTGPYDRY